MPYAQIDFDVLTDARLSAGAKLFLAHLQRWDWGGGCWLTDRQLAREIGVSTRTVRNHTKALEEAGYLWVFEDREGMTVRLVVRPGHVYPRPRGLGKPLPKAWKKVSRLPIIGIKADELEAEKTTDSYQETPVLGEAEPEPEAAVVLPSETDLPVPAWPSDRLRQTGQTETPTPEPPEADQAPDEAVPPVAAPLPSPAAALSLPDAAISALAVLEDAGVARPAAVQLARAYPVRQIRAATRYARQYRGETLNAPGLVVSALRDGWTLPRWSYDREAAQEAAGRTGRPQEAPTAPGVCLDTPKPDAAYFARYRGETMGWVGVLDDRPWAEIRRGLTAEQLRYCEEA